MNRNEAGSVTPLIVGFAVVVLLLIGVVVDTSAAFLARQNLNAAADAAALAATDGMQGEQVYGAGLGEQARIDPQSARRFVAEYLRTSGVRQRYQDLGYEVHTERNRVLVRIHGTVKLPIRVPGVLTSTVVSGSAASIIAISD
ncbi:MAG TPA: pilus assembly protein TadG-related protein [Marmoricola sp.]|nr:pilus assembly protein TadG-related protein [Marmoricola sp.]